MPHSTDSLAVSEAQKYRSIYGDASYKSFDHSVTFAKSFLDRVKAREGEFVLDLGCGPGYATKLFLDRGFRVMGVDIASNSLLDEHQGLFPVLVCALWAVPVQIDADWGFCADVMEHIPTERVGEVLAFIRRSVRKSVFFNISVREDGYGKVIGQTLHMTVRPEEWWLEQLQVHWGTAAQVAGQRGDYACFLVSPDA